MTKRFNADSMGFVGLQGPGMEPSFTKWGRPKLDLVHVTSAPPFFTDAAQALAEHRRFAKVALGNAGVMPMRTHQDLFALVDGDVMGIIFGLQHAPTGMTRDLMAAFVLANLRVMGIAYDGETEYGGGFKTSLGLTERGKDLVRMMAEFSITLDLSHASHQTAMDVLELIEHERLPLKPMASHSGAYSVYPHPRNLTDEVLRSIADAGGYVGVPLITFFLGAEGSDPLANFVAHVSHVASLIGGNNVGVGSDCNHHDMTMEAARAHFDRMTRMLKTDGTFGEYFPDRPPAIIQEGSHLFGVLRFTLLKSSCGGRHDDIVGRNFLHYLDNAWQQ